MIEITVKVYASLAAKYPELAMKQLELNNGLCVSDVIATLEIDKKDIGIIVRNNLRVDLNTILADGDIIMFFPSIGGG